ncbi:MAG: hypothetical protein Kow0063_38580 [Anaerolineae bacterium]
MLKLLLLLLVIASWIYWLVACWLVRLHFQSRREPDARFIPPVSILKPVKGLDAEAYQNFASFCQQDYPDFELLFGVSDPTDPAVPVVERLKRDFPERDIRLIIAPVSFANHKAGLLHMLTSQARHAILVVSDSDMRVTPDYLGRVVAPLADEQVGLVTCLYRGVAPLTLVARLEALYIGVTFLPSVLVARRVLSMRFALGATLVLRRDDLARLGGFAAVADYLADDYQMGARMAGLGRRVHLSDYVVDSILGATSFREWWQREVRWAQCNRVSRPLEYPGLLLTFSTPLAIVLSLITGFAPQARLALGVSLLLRWLVAWLVTGYSGNQELRRWLVWLPVRDTFSALVWGAGALGRRVVWREEVFQLWGDGRLAPLSSSTHCSGDRRHTLILKQMVRELDAALRRFLDIREFSQDERCLLRLAVGRSDTELTLSDGTRVRQGDLLGELHFWNEHIPPLPQHGPDLAWALTFQRWLSFSFRELAAYVQAHPEFRNVIAFRGEISFGGPYGVDHLRELARRWGFDLVSPDAHSGLLRRLADWGANVYAWSLIWTYNPASLEAGRPGQLRRDQIWISREMLVKKYGRQDV